MLASNLQMQSLKVEVGEKTFCVQNINVDDVNSVISNYYQHGPATLHEYTLNELVIVSNMSLKPIENVGSLQTWFV